MPLVARAAAAYALGLAVGLCAGIGTAFLAVMAALLLSVIRGRGWGLESTVAVVFAAGVLIGTADEGRRARCATTLTGVHDWSVVFETPATPGGMTRATVAADGCSERAAILVRTGAAGAGMSASVRGTASVDPRGLFVRDARLRDAAPHASLATVRASAGARVDRIFGADSPMVRALVLGDMSLIPAVQRDRFAQAGLVHMLSVSGLHVAIIALALELLAGVLRLPRRPARLATMIILIGYVASIGAPPPAVRAAVMLALVLVSRTLQRPTSPWAIVALGSVAP